MESALPLDDDHLCGIVWTAMKFYGLVMDWHEMAQDLCNGMVWSSAEFPNYGHGETGGWETEGLYTVSKPTSDQNFEQKIEQIWPNFLFLLSWTVIYSFSGSFLDVM